MIAEGSLAPVRAIFEGHHLGPTWLCPACAARHGVPPAGLLLHGDAGLERYLDDIGFTPVCRHCLSAVYPATR